MLLALLRKKGNEARVDVVGVLCEMSLCCVWGWGCQHCCPDMDCAGQGNLVISPGQGRIWAFSLYCTGQFGHYPCAVQGRIWAFPLGRAAFGHFPCVDRAGFGHFPCTGQGRRCALSLCCEGQFGHFPCAVEGRIWAFPLCRAGFLHFPCTVQCNLGIFPVLCRVGFWHFPSVDLGIFPVQSRRCPSSLSCAGKDLSIFPPLLPGRCESP